MKIVLLCHNNLFCKQRGGEKSQLKIFEYLSSIGHECIIVQPSKNCKITTHLEVISFAHYNEIDEIVNLLEPDLIFSWGSTIRKAYEFKINKNIPYFAFIRTRQDLSRYNNIKLHLEHADKIIANCELGSKLIKETFNLDSIWSYPPIKPKHLDEHNPQYIFEIKKDSNESICEKLAPMFPNEQFLIIDFNTEEKQVGNIKYIPYQKDYDNIWKSIKVTIDAYGEHALAGRLCIESSMYKIPSINFVGNGAETYCPINVKTFEECKEQLTKILKHYKKASNKAYKHFYQTYNINEQLAKIEQALPTNKKALIYIFDGLGNILERSINFNLLKSLGYQLDVVYEGPITLGECLKSMPILHSVDKYEDKIYDEYDLFVSLHPQFRFKNRDTKILVKDITKPERQWFFNELKLLGCENFVETYPTILFKKDNSIPYSNYILTSVEAVNSSWVQKVYPHYKELFSRIDKQVVVVGSSNYVVDQSIFELKNVVNLVGKTDFNYLCNLIDQCDYVLTHDNGLSHLSCSLNKKTYIIYGPTSRIKNMPLGGNIIEKRIKACNLEPCQYKGDMLFLCHENKCLKEFTVDEVLKKIS